MEVDSELKYSCGDILPALVSCSSFDIKSGILCDDVISAPYPNPAELADFASAVYKDMTDKLLQELKLGDWKLLTTARNDAWTNGYFGAAFISPSRQQVVLAHRGTIPRNTGAMSTNLNGVVYNNYSPRMSSAATFADKVKCAIIESNKQSGYRFHLTITGHSLGGWLAQVTGFTVKFLQTEGQRFIKISDQVNGLHAHVVAFESPGCKDMLEEIIDKCDVRYRRTMPLESLDISNYLSAPNRINTFGLHVGGIYRVKVAMSHFDIIDRKTVNYTLKTHSMENLAKALKDNSEIHEIVDWPLSEIKQMFNFWGKTEYKSFYEKVKHADEYHLNPEQYANSSIRYKTTSDKSVSLRMFSEDELKLLDFWVIFKRENIRINKIQSFLTKYGLGEYDNLFDDFTINMNNRTITCASEDELKMVVRRAKLLVRWFCAELMDAVDQQSQEIPKIILSVTNQSYLNSLPKCHLDFSDDKIGFGVFLTSEHRIWQIKTEDCDLEMLRLWSIGRQLREPSPYVQSQTFMRWTDLINLNTTVFTKNLTENDFTNLLVIDCASTDVSGNVQSEKIHELFLRSTNKKIIFVSDRNSNLSFTEVVPVQSSFESSQLTQDSKKKIFANKMLDIGGIILRIEDFLGKQNFENFESQIDKFIKSTDLKNILKSDEYVIKVKNTCPNFIESSANCFTVDRGVDVKSLARVASSGDLLVVSGEHQDGLRNELPGSSSGAENVIWVPETGLAGEERFKQAILDNPEKKVYRLEMNDTSTAATVKQIFHKNFYMTRQFHCQIVFKLKDFASLSESKNIFIFQGAPSKQNLERLLMTMVAARERDIFMNDENIITEPSDREINIIIYVYMFILKGDYKKPVHLLKFEENDERFLWQCSLGSLEGLRPHVIIDTNHAVTEEELGASEQRMVIITDEPGMGKSTSLASISQRLSTAWIFFVDLKIFNIPSGDVPTETSESYEYQLIENLIEGSLPQGILQFCLHQKRARQPYLLFDGFDEMKDDTSKNKMLDILKYFKNKTTANIWVTTRLHDRELLEDSLSTFAVTFKKIEEQRQRDYLREFWRSILLLEPGSCDDKKLEKCALVLFTEAKNLGEGIQNFMGVPLQMRMLGDMFLQRVEYYVTSQIELENTFRVENVFSLYQEFMKVKYDIYLKTKTELFEKMNEHFRKATVSSFAETHRKMSLRMLFPDMAEEYCEDSENDLKGAELCRIGLVKSVGDGRGVEFIHRTLAEYFCADQIACWLGKKNLWYGGAPMVDFLLSDILLRPSNIVIRMFLNNFLKKTTITDTARKYIASHIEKVWSETPQSSSVYESQRTILHKATAESNTDIIKLLVGNLGKEQHQKSSANFIDARDMDGTAVLEYIVWGGDISFVKLLVEKGGDVNSANKNGGTPLHTAAWRGFLEIVQYLVEKGADINFALKDGGNALHHAVREGQLPVAEYLVEKGADVNSANNSGGTALHWAVWLGHFPVVRFLVEKGGNINSANESGNTALHDAAWQGNLPIMEYLLENGGDIKLVDNDGGTPLHRAALEGHLQIVQCLVEKGGDINSTDKDGGTALHRAACRGHLSVMRFLVEKGGDINSAKKEGVTALHDAAQQGYLPVVKYLVEMGGDVNSTDKDSATALHRAAWQGHLSIVQCLVEKEGNINLAKKEGVTALHDAAQQGYLSIVQYLVEKGGDINSADKDGGTALHRAAWQGYLSIVQYLVEKGGDINSSDKDGGTALHRAAWQGHFPVVHYLVEKGGDINSVNKDGDNTLLIAANRGHDRIVQYLKNTGGDD